MRHQELLQVINLMRQVWVATAELDPQGELSDFTTDILNHIAYLYKVAVRWRDEDNEAAQRAGQEDLSTGYLFGGLFPRRIDVPQPFELGSERATQPGGADALGAGEVDGSD